MYVLGAMNVTAPEQAGKKKSTPSKSSDINKELKALDQKWSELFSRLEAMLVAKTLEKPPEQLFLQTVKVPPTKTRSASTVETVRTFLPLTNPADQTGTNQVPAQQQQVPSMSAARSPHWPEAESDQDSDMDTFLEKPFEEEGELSDLDQDSTTAEVDQALSEEQIYRERVQGIRSFMGWTHIPDFDTSSSLAVDTSPLQDQRNNQPARYQSIYPVMSGFV